ncbi:anthranilate phosphoribosyltransferase family protein [filamentous cyanobacterium LEGE 11480]|uniref:Anthranilate phosphoribosyltransferase family protein n=1 Tax=Romeriopsis navalis LEGE 11480 TaxID=2777977 RepID=A0A928Z402_9CYAN|nr:anthranilate phosphoribosyltransferase family protein [Romeriopsis navalis]MBE9032041.1 anthranilate phosphoribosyltransferase family protein [Romeriopsis navalis LEGE 11480]
MSTEFREYLRKIGSGPHTSKSLTREEAAAAYRLMLQAEATPVQIGGFMIAHRIKRPTGEELAGMLDAYNELGPQLQPIDAAYPVMVMCNPYDGRSRTSPLSPLIALILATAGVPVVTPGGDRMPTKMGVPLVDLWQALGVSWAKLSLDQLQQVLAQTLLGLLYLPRHFPLAQTIVAYREQIGKRPPQATLELIWSPYCGPCHTVSGFVHPPTENMFRIAGELHGLSQFTAIKGLEGSCDLPRDRTVIAMLSNAVGDWRRFTLHPQEFGAAAKELPLLDTADLAAAYQNVLAGEPSDVTNATVWSAGFYLWRAGAVATIEAGMALALELLQAGKVKAQLAHLCCAVAAIT